MADSLEQRAREFFLTLMKKAPSEFGNEALNRKRGDWVMLNSDEAAKTLADFARKIAGEAMAECVLLVEMTEYSGKPFRATLTTAIRAKRKELGYGE